MIDKLDRQPREVSTGRLRELGLSSDASEVIIGLQRFKTPDQLREALGKNSAVEARLEELQRYFDYLNVLDTLEWVDLNLTIVRGLAYYTGIVFELFDAKSEFRAICGGGRYDTLLASLSGTDLPALGFGMGDVVLGELLKARGKMPSSPIALDYWVAYEDQSLLAEAMRTATALRRQGSSVEYALRPQSLGKQLDAARKAGARVAVIHRVDGAVKRKDFASGTEEPFTFPNG